MVLILCNSLFSSPSSVCQLEGDKVWDVWEPLKDRMPLLESKKGKGDSHFHLHELADHRHHEVTLHPGDALFLPRGFIHQGAWKHNAGDGASYRGVWRKRSNSQGSHGAYDENLSKGGCEIGRGYCARNFYLSIAVRRGVEHMLEPFHLHRLPYFSENDRQDLSPPHRGVRRCGVCMVSGD